MLGCCEYGNEISCNIKHDGFFDYQRNCQLLKLYPVPWSRLRKLVPYIPSRHECNLEVTLHSFSTSDLMEGSGQRQVTAVLSRGKTLGSHGNIVWMDPRAGPDVFGHEKIYSPERNFSSFPSIPQPSCYTDYVSATPGVSFPPAFNFFSLIPKNITGNQVLSLPQSTFVLYNENNYVNQSITHQDHSRRETGNPGMTSSRFIQK